MKPANVKIVLTTEQRILFMKLMKLHNTTPEGIITMLIKKESECFGLIESRISE